MLNDHKQMGYDELQATVGVLDIACLCRGKIDLPGNGAGTELGVFREIIYEADEDGKFKSSYGNATQDGMFEIGNQLRFAAEQRLRPAWRTLNDIEANLPLREHLIYYIV